MQFSVQGAGGGKQIQERGRRERMSFIRHSIAGQRSAVMLLSLLTLGCGGGLTPSPAPSPRMEPEPVREITVIRRTALPARIPSVTWQVTSTARVRVMGASSDGRGDNRTEQRVESRGRVSWSFDRQPWGALKGTGQVDSFVVSSTPDGARPTTSAKSVPPVTPLVLLEAVVDSLMTRVATRPPLTNECDRTEASAAALAREVLVRIPDGLQRGDSWRDSTVSLICRSGVPVVVHSAVVSTLDRIDGDRLIVKRVLTSTFDGRGGTAFRGLELTGTGTGTQTATVDAVRGTLERLEGSSTVMLQATERLSGAPLRVQRVEQEGRLVVERAR